MRKISQVVGLYFFLETNEIDHLMLKVRVTLSCSFSTNTFMFKSNAVLTSNLSSTSFRGFNGRYVRRRGVLSEDSCRSSRIVLITI